MLDRLSRDDLRHVIDLATRCLSVASYADVEAVIGKLGSVIPFEKAAMCAATTAEAGPSLVHYVNHSYGAEWADMYTRLRFHRVDPVLGHATNSGGAFTWSEAFSREGSRATGAFTEAAMDFGLVDGVSYTGMSSGGGQAIRTVLSLARGGGDCADRALSILGAVGPHLHEAYRRLLPPQYPEPGSIVLSLREREILAWTQEGKTYWEIGCILGISARTVKYHFTRIKTKLDVASPCHAVAKAMKLGLIG
ncbi:hypothetical protein F0U59_49325 [Archangium gephyra]|nr:hypothetical protein F0U59_49325 [Archangium gephyra]